MGKIVIIGTTGIGGALARSLASSGHSLHLVARNADQLSVMGTELGATTAVADVTDAAALDAAVKSAGPIVDALWIVM
jgi:NADP-dependent 3-hydroxy acid dehydrogenase YdfG